MTARAPSISSMGLFLFASYPPAAHAPIPSRHRASHTPRRSALPPRASIGWRPADVDGEARTSARAADRRGLHATDPRVHHGAVLPVAAGGLPARVIGGADSESGPRRHCRRADPAPVLERGVRVHAPAPEG